jgi:hypothetical protein
MAPLYPCATVAYRSAAQVRNKQRVETLIRLAAPALDVVLYAGDKASRVIGRNQIGPEPARRPGLPPGRRH